MFPNLDIAAEIALSAKQVIILGMKRYRKSSCESLQRGNVDRLTKEQIENMRQSMKQVNHPWTIKGWSELIDPLCDLALQSLSLESVRSEIPYDEGILSEEWLAAIERGDCTPTDGKILVAELRKLASNRESVREEARREALEEAAKVADRAADFLRADRPILEIPDVIQSRWSEATLIARAIRALQKHG